MIALLSGCASSDKKNGENSANKVPDWVNKTPLEKGKIYAIGVAGVTYYRSDAQKYAAQNAREELSRTLHVRIQSVMVDWSTEKGSYVDKASIQQVSGWATNIAMSGSSILSYWFDENGAIGPKGFTYCLAVLSLDPQVVDFATEAQEKLDPASKESVKENAKKLFEELSQMEQEQGITP